MQGEVLSVERRSEEEQLEILSEVGAFGASVTKLLPISWTGFGVI